MESEPKKSGPPPRPFYPLFDNGSPIAGLLSAGSLAVSPLFMYWLTFPMFPAVWCWSAGLLYGVTRLARTADLLNWSIVAVSVYSLLMTAYPQPIVFHAYILVGYVGYLTFRIRQSAGSPSSIGYLAACTSAAVVGGALVLPAYLDLAYIASESARMAPDPSFFTIVLPKIDSFASAIRFLVLGTFPEVLGNPISPEYPFPYNGLSLTPLILFLALLGLLLSLRETWGWWLSIGVFCAFTFVQPLYIVGVKYLGFHLSRSTPLGSITLPLTIVAAHGADAMIRRVSPGNFSKALVLTVGCTVTALLIAVFLLGVKDWQFIGGALLGHFW